MRALVLIPVLLPGGCRSYLIDRTDHGVYRLIEDRQKDVLGTTSDAHLEPETGEVASVSRMYAFTPRPVKPGIPETFQPVRESTPAAAAGKEHTEAAGEAIDSQAPAEGDDAAAGAPMSPSVFSPDEQAEVLVFGLKDGLAYAVRQGRDLCEAKEDLYIAALELTLERHLWTPQFAASFAADAEFTDAGGLHDYEQAVTATSEVGLTQHLPYGGELTARVISTLVRDLEAHVTSTETGSLILEADIPLLRGAGRVAYESRYSAERELIYAVRRYERFRRSYLVDVASRYFDLQQTKARINNAYKSYESRKQDWEKADFINRMGRSRTIFEAPRARASFRDAESTLISAKEQYETALDQFKIFIGMPVDRLLDVVDQEEDQASKALDDLLPEIAVKAAIEAALCRRLDLLTMADRVDDSRRAVAVAENQILPDLDVAAGVTLDSYPEHLSSFDYNLERSTYHAGITLRLDDRKAERNAYRAALVSLRRAERRFEESVDTVRAEVRRALRRIRQQKNLRTIQLLNVQENELRAEAARAQYDLGKSTNQDVVDADESLLAARNRLAGAVAGYRNAILEFRLDTGTLRVNDDGAWQEPTWQRKSRYTLGG